MIVDGKSIVRWCWEFGSGDVQVSGTINVSVVDKNTNRNSIDVDLIEGLYATEGDLYGGSWINVIIVQDSYHGLIGGVCTDMQDTFQTLSF